MKWSVRKLATLTCTANSRRTTCLLCRVCLCLTQLQRRRSNMSLKRTYGPSCDPWVLPRSVSIKINLSAKSQYIKLRIIERGTFGIWKMHPRMNQTCASPKFYSSYILVDVFWPSPRCYTKKRCVSGVCLINSNALKKVMWKKPTIRNRGPPVFFFSTTFWWPTYPLKISDLNQLNGVLVPYTHSQVGSHVLTIYLWHFGRKMCGSVLKCMS